MDHRNMNDIGYYDYKTQGRSPFSGSIAAQSKLYSPSLSGDRTKKDAVHYGMCLSGGILSSSVRWLLTPLDGVKCLMQVRPNSYPTLSSGLARLYQEGALYRGLMPTVLSYATQSGTKYMLYEFFRDHAPDTTDKGVFYQSAVYAVSAGCAEAIADVLMCPWEMLKVQVQANPKFPTKVGPAWRAMIERRHELRYPFGSLQPLWSRQVIGTMANFLTFEHAVKAIYTHILQKPKDECATSTQLLVTLTAGYTSGLVSTVVSHPADSIISYKARYPHKTSRELISEIGWRKLATQGLGPRVVLTGSIIGCQWLIYDGFKTVMGMGTTGG
jgi:solute carrier family 25 phosphate transporter 3